jgi:hypothetical protein
LEGSDYSKLRSPEVKATRIGRFLPYHVINMDQSPLAFELTTTGRTYANKGDHTVFLRGGPSGWEKRNCTLMISISEDGLPHVKPLMIYAGAEGIRNRPRRLEMKVSALETVRLGPNIA